MKRISVLLIMLITVIFTASAADALYMSESGDASYSRFRENFPSQLQVMELEEGKFSLLSDEDEDFYRFIAEREKREYIIVPFLTPAGEYTRAVVRIYRNSDSTFFTVLDRLITDSFAEHNDEMYLNMISSLCDDHYLIRLENVQTGTRVFCGSDEIFPVYDTLYAISDDVGEITISSLSGDQKNVSLTPDKNNVQTVDASTQRRCDASFDISVMNGNADIFVDGRRKTSSSFYRAEDISLPVSISIRKEGFADADYHISRDGDLVIEMFPSSLAATSITEDGQRNFYISFFSTLCTFGLSLSSDVLMDVYGASSGARSLVNLAFDGLVLVGTTNTVLNLLSYIHIGN